MNIRNSPRRTGHLNAVSWTRQYHNRHRHTTTATITNKKTTNKVNVVTMVRTNQVKQKFARCRPPPFSLLVSFQFALLSRALTFSLSLTPGKKKFSTKIVGYRRCGLSHMSTPKRLLWRCQCQRQRPE